MDQSSSLFVINGRNMKLPIGFRFLPTDEIVVDQYLKRKVFDLPIPITSAILDFNVFQSDPWLLPGDLKEKRYFFTKERSFLRKRVGCGVWKSNGKQSFVLDKGFNQVIGVKKSLVFSPRSRSRSRTTTTTTTISSTTTTTGWVMDEYRLPSSATTNHTKTQMETRDWAVYCLFQKKRISPKRQKLEEECSCSSGLTEEEDSSSNGEDQEQTSRDLLGFSLSSYSY